MIEGITMAESLPTTAVVRVSRASYDPSRFAEVDAASKKTSAYIIPAIRRLPGLLHFYAGASYSTHYRKAKESKGLTGSLGDRSWARKAII